MVAFVHPNGLAHHRLGITASKKAVGNAVERNRSRRLLREAFRLALPVLTNLNERCDWVLNAKRALLKEKVAGPVEELQQLVARVVSDRSVLSEEAEQIP
jgi:ribonuclease P protein component